MANMLDRNNKHLFLEATDNSTNSFIANINLLASKIDGIETINEKFSVEEIKLLVQLIQNSLDINIKQLAEDLRKGTYKGYRKLDIDLLTNFKNYSDQLSDEDKNALWNDVSQQVYYDKIEVFFNDKTSIYKTLEYPIRNHHTLLEALNDWYELTAADGNTDIFISPDTPIKNHELLRIIDGGGTLLGSTIERIKLYVARKGYNEAYDAAFVGAKSYAPEFAWMDSTSALITVAHKVNEVLHTSQYIEELGANLVDRFEALVATCEELRNIAENYATDAKNAAIEADAVLDKQLGLKVTSNTLSVLEQPTVFYNSALHSITFGLPRSEIAVVGLSKFAVDYANGHLTLETIRDEDVNRVYVNDDGNIIIEMK